MGTVFLWFSFIVSMPCNDKNDQRKVMAFHAGKFDISAKPMFVNSRPHSTWLEHGLVFLVVQA